jgi:hypothetical protein
MIVQTVRMEQKPPAPGALQSLRFD